MKRYRINTTQTHLNVLWIASRLVNITARALVTVLNSSSEDHYRRYLNDLTLDGYLYKRSIYQTAQTGSAGARLGTLYALTNKGADLLLETGLVDQEVYFYKEGIRANSPLHTLHRMHMIQVLALLLQQEQQEHWQVLDIVPYFQKVGSPVFGNSKAQCTINTPLGDIIPDALVRLEISGKIRVIAFELHRVPKTTRILEQLEKHTYAIEHKLLSAYFNESSFPFVCSVHENTNALKSTIQRIREIKDFERFNKGFHFASLEDLQKKGFQQAFYHANGEKSKLFD
jgi:hypothetical protein